VGCSGAGWGRLVGGGLGRVTIEADAPLEAVV
jgi:hypothetical protein